MLSDRLGRLHPSKELQKVLSLVPSWTEFLSEVIRLPNIVGRTEYCILPEEIKKIPTIGGTKNPDIKKIIEFSPDLIIANKEENKQIDVNQLRANGLEVFVTGAVTVLEAVEEMFYLEFLLTQNIDYTEQILQGIQVFEQENQFTFAYLVWNDPIMVAGSQTYINSVITQAGGENIFGKTKSRYPKIDVQRLIYMKPDFLFLPDEPYDFRKKHQINFNELLVDTKVLLVDGKLASWYGGRIIEALSFFGNLDPEY